MPMLALWGHALTASAMGRSQVHPSPFCLVCDPNHLSLFISGAVSAGPACRHTLPFLLQLLSGTVLPLGSQDVKELPDKQFPGDQHLSRLEAATSLSCFG